MSIAPHLPLASGHHQASPRRDVGAAANGQFRIGLDLAPNEVPGLWRIHVEELASGRTADAYLRVTD